jgi:hypothetical protein
MLHSVEFFAQCGVKIPMFQKDHMWSCPPHGRKIKLKIGNYLNKNISLRAMQYSSKLIFVVEYLSEYKSIIETASVELGVLFDEKA